MNGCTHGIHSFFFIYKPTYNGYFTKGLNLYEEMEYHHMDPDWNHSAPSRYGYLDSTYPFRYVNPQGI